MFEVEGFVLAGGASSRMGADKARLDLGGETLVARAARSLSTIAGRVSVVSSRDEHARLGLPVIPDIHTSAGALGGIHAALAACRAPWAAIVSCDLPFVTGGLLSRLASLRDANVEAVAPVQQDGKIQPLCALYRRATCLRVTEEFLAAGERRPRVLLKQLSTRWVVPEELADLPRAELFFLNVNTPEDYERAKATMSDERWTMN